MVNWRALLGLPGLLLAILLGACARQAPRDIQPTIDAAVRATVASMRGPTPLPTVAGEALPEFPLPVSVYPGFERVQFFVRDDGCVDYRLASRQFVANQPIFAFHRQSLTESGWTVTRDRRDTGIEFGNGQGSLAVGPIDQGSWGRYAAMYRILHCPS